MLFTNQKIDVVNIPLKPMEKIHHESSPLFEENNVKETKQVCETLLKEAHQQKEILLKSIEEALKSTSMEDYYSKIGKIVEEIERLFSDEKNFANGRYYSYKQVLGNHIFHQ